MSLIRYLYAQGDPLNRVDPQGLYDTDVHYYMTYFLALTAGLSESDAWIIATADQTMDNVNPYTDAFPSLAAGGNFDARKDYHFTQKGFDPAPNADEVTYTTITDPVSGVPSVVTTYSSAYQLRRLAAWNNPQIQTLNGYALGAPSCVKQQFYGEYLHALEDTFGHRDANDDPYGPTLGHFYDGHDPDMTYNHGTWQVNEQRTIEMETVVFAQLQSDWGASAKNKDGNVITFASIQGALETWNKIPEIGNLDPASEKLKALNDKLNELGLASIPAYDVTGGVGLGCRLKYLRDANLINTAGKATSDAKTEYPGAILDTKTEGAAECTH
jgi:hypothetical protein